MGTQMQIEAGNFLNLTTDKGSTVQLWDIMASTMDGNILQEIASATSWQQGFIWHYNTPVPIQQVTGPQHMWYRALINGLEYTGTQALNKMTPEVQQHLNLILENQHPLQQGSQLPYWGAKAAERLRGNPTILQYVNGNINMSQYVIDFNEYHSPTRDDDNMKQETQG